MENQYTLCAGGLKAEVCASEKASITLWNERNGQRLFITHGADMLCPVVDGVRPELKLQSVEAGEGTLLLRFTGDLVNRFDLTVDGRGKHLLFSASFVTEGKELNAIDIMPPQTGINCYDLINFRNWHGTPSTWPELPLTGKVETTTFSTDNQFAPHPSMLVFRKNETAVLAAPLELHHAYGFNFKSREFVLESWQLDYGCVGHGEPMVPDQAWQTPTIAFVKADDPVENGNYNANVFKAIDGWCRLLIDGGYIPDPGKANRIPWHTDNLYCTWIDQSNMYKNPIVYDLNAQMNAGKGPRPQDFLNEAFVRKAADIILKENLPLRTILIDDGWQKNIGEWEVDERKFPNFRGLIDDLHAMGFKVLLWINFADIYNSAQVDEKFLCPNYLSKYNMRAWRFSDPEVRKAYFEPLIRRMISDEPGCYNADGIKTDFLADKIEPKMPCTPDWRGEENYYVHLIGEMYRLMKQLKSDACHIGCAGHPYLAQYMDVVRTYDIFSSNAREHLERGRMVYHTSAKSPVTFDFHTQLENFEDYYDYAEQTGCSVEVGNIMTMKRDYFTDVEPADSAYYELLRRNLARVGKKTSKF